MSDGISNAYDLGRTHGLQEAEDVARKERCRNH